MTQVKIKFNEWFDNWGKKKSLDKSKDPEVRRLCESSYSVGYLPGRERCPR
jgi:hypothetical protein